MKTMKQIGGFSAVEVLLALVVGSILMIGVIQIADNSAESFRIQSGVMTMQQNGQFAMSYLSKDIRNVDFWGCMGANNTPTNLLTGGGGYATPLAPLSGTSNAPGTGTQVAGSDTITVQGVQTVSSGQHVVAPFGPTSASALTVNSTSNISANSIVLVSDCLGGDIFQATGIASNAISHTAGVGSPGNISGNLSKVYDGTASVYLPYTRTYDIRTGAWGGAFIVCHQFRGHTRISSGSCEYGYFVWRRFRREWRG